MTARFQPSLRQAVDAKCKECIYDPISPGTWREQVGECTSTTCPLHVCRPLPIEAQKQRAKELARTAATDGPHEGELALSGSEFGQDDEISEEPTP